METARVLLALSALVAAACSGAGLAPVDAGGSGAAVTEGASGGSGAAPSSSGEASTPPVPGTGMARMVDPRRGGLEVGLGEWAVALEADHVRPGRVTFVVVNRGTAPHGFEIEGRARDAGGSGSGDGLEVESRVLGPGESARVTLVLGPGVYVVECLVDGHDDMGMETLLRVSADAPLVRTGGSGGAPGPDGPAEVLIEGFAFAPPSVEVPAGTEVTWANVDPADHTVTARDGSFTSDPLGRGGTFSRRFDDPGTYAYLCAIHPGMRGVVVVSP